jgi:hypothetical protein
MKQKVFLPEMFFIFKNEKHFRSKTANKPCLGTMPGGRTLRMFEFLVDFILLSHSYRCTETQESLLNGNPQEEITASE